MKSVPDGYRRGLILIFISRYTSKISRTVSNTDSLL